MAKETRLRGGPDLNTGPITASLALFAVNSVFSNDRSCPIYIRKWLQKSNEISKGKFFVSYKEL